MKTGKKRCEFGLHYTLQFIDQKRHGCPSFDRCLSDRDEQIGHITVKCTAIRDPALWLNSNTDVSDRYFEGGRKRS